MNRLLVLLLLLLYSINSNAEKIGRSYIFQGLVLSADSIPVENAYMVNYRNARTYTTDIDGRFRVPVQQGDSLKIVHVSFQPIIVKVSVNDTIIILNYNENIIETVTVKLVDVELQHFYKNMEVMKMQIDKMSHYNYRNTKVQNPYNTNQFTGTTGIAISDIIKLFKKRKR